MAGVGALAASGTISPMHVFTKRYPLGASATAYRGGLAVINAYGYVVPATKTTGLKVLGLFAEDVDNSDGASGAKVATIELPREKRLFWLKNGTSGDAVAATDIGKMVYALDDQSVSIVPTSASPVGKVYGYDSAKDLVLVELLIAEDTTFSAPVIADFSSATHGHTNNAGGGVLAAPAITSFASATHTHANAAGGGTIRMADGGTLAFTGVTCTISTPGTWTHYRAPASATQNSVIALGNTGATMGDVIKITSAGAITYTITYYDGTYARTAALSASKSHAVIASYDGAAWIFDYTVNAN